MAIQSSSDPGHRRAATAGPARLVAAEPLPAERDGGRDEGLRPRRLSDYVGQPELKQVLGLALAACRQRGE
ncbi:MAG: Holliday junction branch migration DNA helicase RuvB, partial [Prochlorococcaceae cyanobacterium]